MIISPISPFVNDPCGMMHVVDSLFLVVNANTVMVYAPLLKLNLKLKKYIEKNPVEHNDQIQVLNIN